MSINIDRPDLSSVAPDVVAYIEALEAQISQSQSPKTAIKAEAVPEPSEPPTTINVITFNTDNVAKRTPRHFYTRQRRGGMGVFDLDTPEEKPPKIVITADLEGTLLLFSNFGRAFRMAVAELTETAVHAKGQSFAHLFPFRPHEKIVAALRADANEYVVLVSQRGWVRRIRANYLGRNMIAGTTFHDVKEGGYLVSACWTAGNGDLFIATQQGKGIRFSESQVPSRGCLGMRVYVEDRAVAVTAVTQDSGVFLATDNGKGTIRLMSGFSANKAPGAGGKVAIKTDNLIGATAVTEDNDLFLISKTGKMIRFTAGEIPPKEGVVQGVNCMALRNDVVTAVAST